MTALVNVIVTLGMLYVVPAGLRLIDPARLLRTARLWPVAAAPGALCLWLPRGMPATVLAVLYAAACLALAARAPVLLLRARSLTPPAVAVATALVSPSIAATALVAERAQYRLFGFDLDILALTVPHFHFAGFTAALVAGLVCRAVGAAPGPAASRAVRRTASRRAPSSYSSATSSTTGPSCWARWS